MGLTTTTAARAAVVIAYDDGSRLHDVPGHPETAQRLRAVTERLVADPVLRRLPATVVSDADAELMLGVHDEAHLLAVEHVARSGGGWVDGDTYCTSGSYDVALRAAGTAVAAVGAVCSGEAAAAFALIRPPGHHATRQRAMGFCLFNNAAVAVRAAQRRFGVGRVAIIDIDVHHGNGTQEIFYDDPSVLYCSLHQSLIWPGTGRASETGEGAGAGTTLNIPLPAHTTADEWLVAFDAVAAPALRRHAPELIVVSAGYDAHRADPLAELELETTTYAEVTRRITGIAAECAGGRTVWVLEGGYDLNALAGSVTATLHALV